MKLGIILLFCLAVVTISVFSPSWASKSDVETDFDYFILAQFWPSTSCVYFASEHKDCYVPHGVTGWTIHGLWPSIPGTEKPVYCNDSMKFDFSQIEGLSSRLTTDWPYYCKDCPKTFLWQHEWIKHGTCAFSLPLLKGEFRYFNQTMTLHDKLKTLQILAAGHIIPSEDQQYDPHEIFDVVKKGYGYIPNIKCFKDEKTHTYYFDQVWLCFDKQLKQIDCPDVSGLKKRENTLYFKSMKEGTKVNSYFQDCPEEGKIYYKPIPRMF